MDLPFNLDNSFIVQFTNFIYCNNRFLAKRIITKIKKYQSLINNLINNEQKVDLFIFIIVGARATIHTPSMKILKNKLKIIESIINQIFSEINTIATIYYISNSVRTCYRVGKGLCGG